MLRRRESEEPAALFCKFCSDIALASHVIGTVPICAPCLSLLVLDLRMLTVEELQEAVAS